ncbi:MAG: MG2 domain-containing protein [Myxococcota bacterium]
MRVELPVQIDRRGIEDRTAHGALVLSLLDIRTNQTLANRSVSAVFPENRSRQTVEQFFPKPGLTRAEAASLVLVWAVQGRAHTWRNQRRGVYSTLAPAPFDVVVRAPATVHTGARATVRVLVREPDGHPLPNASVEGRLGTQPDLWFEGRTDRRGEFLILASPQETPFSGPLHVTVTHREDVVSAAHAFAVRRPSSVYLSSDKTIYQPGQDVHLRLLALDGRSREPRAGTEVEFRARDARDNLVFRADAVTDEFGVAATSVPTDTRVHEGEWAFSALIEGEETAFRLPVRRYELPPMRVEVLPERPFVARGEALRGSVRGAYRFGEPVAEADVVLELRSETGTVLTQLAGRTDERGAFRYALEADGLAANSDRPKRLTLSAVLTDSANQREAAEARVVVTSSPLFVKPIVAPLASGALDAEVLFVVSDPLGRPIAAALEIQGIQSETDASGVGALQLPAEWYGGSLVVEATDGAGRTAQQRFDFRADPRPLRVETSQPIYQAGDTARIQVFGDADLQDVFVEVYVGHESRLSATVTPSPRGAELAVPLEASQSGVLTVDVFAIAPTGALFEHTARALIQRDDRLRVELGSSQATYRPGASASLSVDVRDQQGEPQVAAIGMAVVDEAVFVLGGEPATSIESAFGIGPELLGSAPALLSVAPNEVLNATPGEARDRLARILLHGGSSEGVTRTESEVTTVQRILEEAIELALREIVRNGALVEGNPQRVEDPFGTPYRMERAPSHRDALLRLISAGPDEWFGTGDDVSMVVTADNLGGL